MLRVLDRSFATDSGKKVEFYTPQPVAKLMTQIAFLGRRRAGLYYLRCHQGSAPSLPMRAGGYLKFSLQNLRPVLNRSLTLPINLALNDTSCHVARGTSLHNAAYAG